MSERRRLNNPPIVTAILTVQFAPALASLTMLDIVDIFGLYRDRYPIFTQISRAGPMVTDPRRGVPVLGFVEAEQLPRVSFASADLSRSIYFQDDRVSVAWTRQGGLDEATDYPHYEGMKERLLDELMRFINWARESNFPTPSPSVIEVLYQNGFHVEFSGRQRTMSELFTFFNNPRKARMSAFSFSWSELVRPSETGTDAITGVINMQTSVGRSPTGAQVVVFGLTGTSITGDTWSEVEKPLDEVHDRIAEIFDASIQEQILKADLP